MKKPLIFYPAICLLSIVLYNPFSSSIFNHYTHFLVNMPLQVDISPSLFDVTLEHGDSIVYPLSITNTSDNSLTINLDGALLDTEKNFEVLALINGADVADEYTNSLAAINTYYDNYLLTEITTYEASELALALEGKDLLFIPEQEDCDGTAFTSFAPILQNFAENGGTIVFTGTNQTNCIFNTGLFQGSYKNFYNGPVNVSLTENALMQGVSNPYEAATATFYYDITNDDAIRLVEVLGVDDIPYDVVCYRNIGSGKAILIGHDYKFSNADMDRILANTIIETANIVGQGNLFNWLYINNNTTTLASGETTTIEVEFNASTIYGGYYTQNLIISSDNPDDALIIPCGLTVTGVPDFAIDPGNFDFGQTLQNDTITQNFTIINNGSDSLQVYTITISNPAFSVNPSTFALYGGGSSQSVAVSFSPSAVNTYSASMTIATNIQDYIIALSGEGLPSAHLIYDPDTVEMTLNVGETGTFPISLSNTGLADLNFSIDTTLFVETLNILSYTNGVDLSNEYANTFSAINLNFNNYILTETNTTNAAILANLLADVDLFLVPEIEDFTAANSFSLLQGVLNDFVTNGGSVIFLGTAGGAPINNSNLINGTTLGNNGNACEILNNTHPITQGLNSSFLPSNGTYPLLVSSSDAEILVSQETATGGQSAIAAIREIGEGYVVYIAFDFFDFDENAALLLGNALHWISQQNQLDWLSFSPLSGELSFPDGNTEIMLTFDASNLLGGTYNTLINFTTNDPLNYNLSIPVSLTVVGIPQLNVNPNTLFFDPLIIGNTDSTVITISNPGTGVLVIDNISSDNAAFYTDINNLTVAPLEEAYLIVYFEPAAISPYDANLLLENNVLDVTLDLFGEGLGTPLFGYDTGSFDITLNAGETTSETINLYNTGEGLLSYYIDTTSLSATIKILVYKNGVDTSIEYPNTFLALNTHFTNYTLTETTTNDPLILADLLSEHHLFLVPEIEDFDIATAFMNFGEVIANYVTEGGNILFLGTSGATQILGSGLFTGESSFDNSLNCEVILEDNPMANDLDLVFSPSNGAYPIIFGDTESTHVVIDQAYDGANGGAIAAYRELGSGLVQFIAFDYYEFNANSSKLLANAVQWAANRSLLNWLSFDQTNGNIDFPSGTTAIEIQFDASNLVAGTYTADIIFYTNDPFNPQITLATTLTVLGEAALTVSDETLVFGNVIVGSTEISPLTIENTGTDTLFISDITASLPQYTLTNNNDFILPQTSIELLINFTPSTIDNYTANLTITSNIGTHTIGLVGFGVGAPEITISPNSFELTLLAGEQISSTLNISNTGQGPLSYYSNGSDAPIEILALTYGMNVFSFNGLQSALSSSSLNYNLSQTNTISPENLATELQEKQVLIIPSQSGPSAAVISSFSSVLQDFTTNGGIVIFLGNSCQYCINNTSLLAGDFLFSLISNPIDIINTVHPITEGIESPLFLPPTSYAYDFINADFNTLAGAFGGSTLGYRNISSGKVLYLGYDYIETSETMNLILERAIKWATDLPDWLSLSDYEAVVATDEDFELTLTFDASGLLAGTYTYDLILFSNDLDEATSTITCTMHVQAFPQAAFSADDTISCDGIVAFTDLSLNESSSWLWDFGDGNTSTQQNPIHIYETEDTYTISLTACNDLGCDELIIADYLTFDSNSVFCSSVSMPINGNLLLTECSGILLDSGGENVYPPLTNSTVTIAPTGAVNVSLLFNFIDLENCMPCDGIRIYDGPDIDSPLIGEYHTTNDLPTDATITSSGGTITIEMWSDTSISFDGFELLWQCGLITTTPTPSFDYEIVNACEGIVTFTDTSTDYPSEWTWLFADGSDNLSTEQNPTYAFPQSGTYDVILTTCNLLGCESILIPVTIDDVLFVDITLPTTIEQGVPIQFVDNTIGASSWLWSFGNGNDSALQSPVVFYNEMGSYTVSITVSNGICTRTNTFIINVFAVGIPQASPTALSFTVHPNPTNEPSITLHFNRKSNSTISIALYNILGNNIYTHVPKNGFDLQYTLDIKHYAQGIYILVINEGGHLYSQKIIIE